MQGPEYHVPSLVKTHIFPLICRITWTIACKVPLVGPNIGPTSYVVIGQPDGTIGPPRYTGSIGSGGGWVQLKRVRKRNKFTSMLLRVSIPGF